ncbi:hypothetical protein HK102_011997, partial [Quaeritorhiza haematococci]
WIEDFFELAGSNIQVNGMEYAEAFKAIEEYEPFDEALHAETERASLEYNVLLSRVTQLRRRLAEDVEGGFEDLWMGMVDVLDRTEAYLGERGMGGNVVGDVEDAELVDRKLYAIMNELKLENLKEKHEEALAVLKGQTKSMPQLLSKLEKLNAVLNDLGVAAAAAEPPDTPDAEDEPLPPVTPRRARSRLLQKLKTESQLAMH